MAERYIVVQPQIVGTVDQWEIVYYSDRVPFNTRELAIRHGWQVHGHDDWLLAVVRGDRVVGTAFQYEDRDEPEERAAIAEVLGMEDG